MMLSISTTKFLIAELAVADYNFHRWTSKPTEYYSVNSKPTCKPPELHTIMKKCNGTGMVLKICETKNNVWKRHILSIQNSIDNHIKTTRIKPNFASLNDPQMFRLNKFYPKGAKFFSPKQTEKNKKEKRNWTLSVLKTKSYV